MERIYKSSDAIYNASELMAYTKVGCYSCITVFNSSEVKDYCDDGQTGLCPHCGIDSLLPNCTDEKVLTNMCEEYFTGTREV